MSDTARGDEPIALTLSNWHRHLRGDFPGGLDELLHDDVVFYSPVVFTPQVGKEITKMYLTAAGGVFGGEPSSDGADGSPRGGSDVEGLAGGAFRYTREIAQGHQAMLEFETRMGSITVNGVDIMACDDDGKIVEFRVLIRPLQAVNAVHQNMMAMLDKMNAGTS